MPHATRSTGAAFRASHTRVRILLIALAFILGVPMPSLAIEVRCDFNGDGIEDLAVSAPESNFKETQSASGSVHVFLGTEVGLSDQSSIDIFGGSLWIDPAYITHSLGERVACGDFDGNGLDDLAIGAREMVHIFLATGRADLFSAATSFAEFQHSDYTFPKEIGFGTAGFASGDFDGDGYDDLAVGAPGVLDRFGGPNGLVYIYWGREPGLHRHWVSFFYTCAFRSCGGVGGSGIGGTIHVGNVNGDEYDDLFVDMGGTWVILHGDGNGYPVGPDVRSHYRFDPDTNAGIPADDPWHGVCRLDSCLNGRFVGVVSDFDGDGFDDVVYLLESGDPQIVFGTDSVVPGAVGR